MPNEDRTRCFRNLVGLLAVGLTDHMWYHVRQEALIREIKGIAERHPDFLPGMHFSPDTGLSSQLEDFFFSAGVWQQIIFSGDELMIEAGVLRRYADYWARELYTEEELAIIAEEGEALAKKIKERRLV